MPRNKEPRLKLPYGTKVRIVNDPYNMYNGKVGYIEGDNWIERLTCPRVSFQYFIAIPTPDNQDIEHTHAETRYIRVFREQGR
jgi:hypothetical protein